MRKKRLNKKGVSIIIGYVLLVVFAMIIGTIVYQTMKTYVPRDVEECPDGVSIFIQFLNYSNNQLNLTIVNNGLFNIAGIYVRATNSSTKELATKDLSPFLEETQSQASIANNAVFFLGGGNVLKPNEKRTIFFNVDEAIYSIEITPGLFQTEGNTYKFLSCGNSKVKEIL